MVSHSREPPDISKTMGYWTPVNLLSSTLCSPGIQQLSQGENQPHDCFITNLSLYVQSLQCSFSQKALILTNTSSLYLALLVVLNKSSCPPQVIPSPLRGSLIQYFTIFWNSVIIPLFSFSTSNYSMASIAQYKIRIRINTKNLPYRKKKEIFGIYGYHVPSALYTPGPDNTSFSSSLISVVTA